MIGRLKSVWDWFVGGLAEAVLWLIDRARRRAPYRIEIGAGDAPVLGPDGSAVATLRPEAGAAPALPPPLAERLRGAPIDLCVPAAWMFRRSLDPVALQSVPFLDAFVRHQIERITPWRAADVFYSILQSPVAGDAARVGVEIAVVPKRLLEGWIAALGPLQPRPLRVRAQGSAERGDVAILIGGAAGLRMLRVRSAVTMALLAAGLGFAGVAGWLWWQAGEVEADIEAQDHVIEERKAVLARAQRRDQPGRDADGKLRDLRRATPRAVDVIEALSQALPDSAYLTDLHLEKDRLTLSGIATDTARLVPALETSGRFADVAFGAATTRLDAGEGDRFHLEMRILGAAVPAP